MLEIPFLEDVVRCVQENLRASGGKRRLLFYEAREWLFSDDTGWFCSFVSICPLLNLDPNYVRRGLLQWESRARKSTQIKQQGSATVQTRLVA